MSTPATNYGTWNNHGDQGSVCVEDTVATYLGEFVDQYDADALSYAYREAINNRLPGDIVLVGDHFYGPYPRNNDLAEQISEIISEINLATLAERYDVTAGKG